jgi:hypothetical protein
MTVMENKTIAPKAKIKNVMFVLEDGTKIEWSKSGDTFDVFRRLPGEDIKSIKSTLIPSIENAYFLLESEDFK